MENCRSKKRIINMARERVFFFFLRKHWKRYFHAKPKNTNREEDNYCYLHHFFVNSQFFSVEFLFI